MIHGYLRAMFFQTASQRIKQMAWYTISPKLAESLMAMAPCSLALILFSCSLLAGVTLNKTRNFQSNCVPANVVSHWNLNPCNMKEDILCWERSHHISPTFSGTFEWMDFAELSQHGSVKWCQLMFDVFPFFLPRCGGRGSCGFGGRSAVWRTGGTWTDEGGHWMDVEVRENP